MNLPISSKWNARYAHSDASVPAPAEVLRSGAGWLHQVVKHGAKSNSAEAPLALDLACGRAGNGQWLARRGYNVTAWDISDTVINEIRSREPSLIQQAVVRDVSKNPPEPDSFDLIVVSRFLDRSLCPAIQAALKPGGVLFYQTFTHGLSNPDYLLGTNELLVLFAGLDILEYQEPAADAHGKAEARLIARRRPLAS